MLHAHAFTPDQLSVGTADPVDDTTMRASYGFRTAEAGAATVAVIT